MPFYCGESNTENENHKIPFCKRLKSKQYLFYRQPAERKALLNSFRFNVRTFEFHSQTYTKQVKTIKKTAFVLLLLPSSFHDTKEYFPVVLFRMLCALYKVVLSFKSVSEILNFHHKKG